MIRKTWHIPIDPVITYGTLAFGHRPPLILAYAFPFLVPSLSSGSRTISPSKRPGSARKSNLTVVI